MIYGLIEIGIIVLFSVVLIRSLIFWIRRRHLYSYIFIPFCINMLFLVLVILLPLNWIKDRLEFSLYYNRYEVASDLAIKAKPDSASYLYMLPSGYQSLSVGGGEVLVTNKEKANAVLFFTFRGVPDGMSGFVKTRNSKKNNYLIREIFNELYQIKDLGNNWYYVSGN